jgi:O-antigen ligase
MVAILLGAAVVALGDRALYGLFGVMAFVVFVRHPVVGVFVTTLLLLLLSGAAGVLGSLQAPVPVTFAKISGFVTAIAWLIHTLARRTPVRFRIEEGFLLAFFAWVFFGVMASDSWRQQLPEWVRLATLVVFFFIAVNVLTTRRLVHQYVLLLAYCGFVMAIFAVAQYFIPALHYDAEQLREIGAGAAQGAYVDPESLSFGAAVRVSGTSGHSNWLAFALLLIVPLNVYWFHAAKGWPGKSLAMAATVLEIMALMLTFTRTGLIVGTVVLALLILRRLVRMPPHRIAAIAVLMLIGFFFIPAAYKERVLNFGRYSESSSIQHRAQLMGEATELTAENPVLGAGLGGFGIHLIEQDSEVAVISRWLVDEYEWNPSFLGAHNMYLHVASETGIVGLALMSAFLLLIVRHLLNAEALFKKADDKQGALLCSTLLVSLISFFVCALLLHALQQKIWWMIVAAAAAAPFVEVRNGKSGHTQPDSDHA